MIIIITTTTTMAEGREGGNQTGKVYGVYGSIRDVRKSVGFFSEVR